MAEKIGEIFLRKKLVNTDQLERALQEQIQTGEFLGEILIRLGYANEENLLKVLAEQFGTRFVSLNDIRVNPQVLKMVPKRLVTEHKFLPIEMRSGVLLIAVSNPLDVWPISVLQEQLKLMEVQIVLAMKNDILRAINKYYAPETGVLNG